MSRRHPQSRGRRSEGRSGLYFDRQRRSRANPQAYDVAARDRLRRLSLEPTGRGRRPEMRSLSPSGHRSRQLERPGCLAGVVTRQTNTNVRPHRVDCARRRYTDFAHKGRAAIASHRMRPDLSTNACGIDERGVILNENRGHSNENEQHAPRLADGPVSSSAGAVHRPEYPLRGLRA
jgi:hypothetical protein